jgi:endonuclease/exonuclease/phosphatase family metal-dependent hydrolase
MDDIFQRQYARFTDTPPLKQLRVLNWNIERGVNLSKVMEVIDKLGPDLCILQEVDLNAKRTGKRHVADLLAAHFQFNYVFGIEFEEVSQGSGQDRAFHGQAVLARCPIAAPRVLRFSHQSGMWRPRRFLPPWVVFQPRRGGRMALVAELAIGLSSLVVYDLHLESQGDDDLRMWQLSEVVRDSRRYSPDTPVIVAGDMYMRSSQSLLRRYLVAAGFEDARDDSRCGGTKPSRDTRGWIFTRGSAVCSDTKVHQEVKAFDHYPLSTNLTLIV